VEKEAISMIKKVLKDLESLKRFAETVERWELDGQGLLSRLIHG